MISVLAFPGPHHEEYQEVYKLLELLVLLGEDFELATDGEDILVRPFVRQCPTVELGGDGERVCVTSRELTDEEIMAVAEHKAKLVTMLRRIPPGEAPPEKTGVSSCFILLPGPTRRTAAQIDSQRVCRGLYPLCRSVRATA